MIGSIVRLLIAFPSLGRLFLSVRDVYIQELANRRARTNRLLINRWVHDSETKPDTRNDPEP